jgi:hypothetical protein
MSVKVASPRMLLEFVCAPEGRPGFTTEDHAAIASASTQFLSHRLGIAPLSG